MPVRSRFWRTGKLLDQDDTDMCVEFSWEGFLRASPMPTRNVPKRGVVYNRAQNIDEFEDTPPEGGTSVRAGAKALVELGHIEGQYLWGFNANDARDFVITRGCVIFGTWWYDDMFEPDRKGFIHIGGGEAGGHAYLVCGYSVPRNAFRCLNSWGDWGPHHGRFWLPFDEAERLIRDDGEVCSVVETRVVPARAPVSGE